MCYLTDVILLNETNNHTNVLQSLSVTIHKAMLDLGEMDYASHNRQHTQDTVRYPVSVLAFSLTACVRADLWKHTQTSVTV